MAHAKLLNAKVFRELASGTALADIPGVVQFTSPGGNDMTSIFLVPTPVTQENLQAVIDGNVITQEALCQGVEAGAVAACP